MRVRYLQNSPLDSKRRKNRAGLFKRARCEIKVCGIIPRKSGLRNVPAKSIQLRFCPKCQGPMSLMRVAAGPSPDYEAHTFECAKCRFRYTARIDRVVWAQKKQLGH